MEGKSVVETSGSVFEDPVCIYPEDATAGTA